MSERTVAKELGKIAPYVRKKGRSKEPQRIGPSDCLAKTQLYAKSKDDVYGVTPARCWKVKRRSESFELKPQ